MPGGARAGGAASGGGYPPCLLGGGGFPCLRGGEGRGVRQGGFISPMFFSGADPSDGGREAPMNSYALRIAIAALASGAILAGGRPALAQVRAEALAGAAVPRPSFVVVQAHPALATPAPAPAPDQPIGLPRVRDYEPIRELEDIYFDSGKAVIRRRRCEDLGRDLGVAARQSRLPGTGRRALRQSGGGD